MNMNDILDVYDEVKEDLNFITTSSIRTKIILSLKERGKRLNEFKIQGSLKPSLSHALKKLENEDMIFKKGKRYFLSSLGRIYAVKYENLFKSFSAVKNCEKMWLNHLIDGIPSFLIKKIGYLNNSFIVESTPTDIIKPHTYYAEILSRSSNIKIVSPIFYYPLFDLYTSGLQNEAEAEIILTPLIFDAMIKSIGLERLEETISLNNLKFLSIDEDIKIALTVTERFLNLGLFLNDGIYDATMSLVSYDEDAISWGEELYCYYFKKAKIIHINDI